MYTTYQKICLVGHLDVLSVGVGLGVHCNSLDSESSARVDDTARDLTTIGNQDFVKELSREYRY